MSNKKLLVSAKKFEKQMKKAEKRMKKQQIEKGLCQISLNNIIG